jgi:cytochrome b pre-mRNA-processing protein 3
MKNNNKNLYNNFIKLTTNKYLYKGILSQQDVFSDRLSLFLLHFAFFLKEFKNSDNQKVLQEIYDFNFRQLELSIREIGYGDQSVNKKMKDYLNSFHAIISNIHFWNELDNSEKKKKISPFLSNFQNIDYLVDYFDVFRNNLANKTLKSFLKSVSKH